MSLPAIARRGARRVLRGEALLALWVRLPKCLDIGRDVQPLDVGQTRA